MFLYGWNNKFKVINQEYIIKTYVPMWLKKNKFKVVNREPTTYNGQQKNQQKNQQQKNHETFWIYQQIL